MHRAKVDLWDIVPESPRFAVLTRAVQRENTRSISRRKTTAGWRTS